MVKNYKYKSMRLACSIIIKDDTELQNLQNCLNSVVPYFETVLVVANGEQVGGIQTLCTTYPNVIYQYKKWENDFSAIRNYSFDELTKIGDFDYLFWIDTDDVLVGGEHLLNVANTAKKQAFDVVFLTYWYGCTFDKDNQLVSVDVEHMRERLIRPGSITWKGRLHETPVPVENSKHKYTSVKYSKEYPISVMHTSTNETAQSKMQRNKDILEIQLEEERKKGDADPRTLLYLMKIYADLNDEKQWKKLLTMGEEYMRKSGWDQERGTCLVLMGRTYQQFGRHQEALEKYHEAIKEYPYMPEAYLYVAHLYYDLKEYNKARHWLDLALSIKLPEISSDIVHISKLKVMSANLKMRLAYYVDKDIKQAIEYAQILYKADPIEDNLNMLNYLLDLGNLNTACEQTHAVLRYLNDIGDLKSIRNILDALPTAISAQKFAINIRKAVTPPKRWAKDEIAYFVNFNGPALEKWDGNSVAKGLGGSETMAIQLAEEMVKKGYKVTIYGDPEKITEVNGVKYLPYYYFNPVDYFNILIQWRHWFLADQVKAKRFYVDLHDVFTTIDITKSQLNAIDKFMVKSEAHKALVGKDLLDKFTIIPNAIYRP